MTPFFYKKSIEITTTKNFTSRRPHDPDRVFALGEFTKLFQKSLETVDLTFTDGIDWQAFFQSFQNLRQQYADENLFIQEIEKKSGGAFVIRLEAPAEVDKAEIQQAAMENYEKKLQQIESRYQERLQLHGEQLTFYREQTENERNRNTRLERILEVMAEKQGNTYNIGNLKGGSVSLGGGNATGGTFNDYSQNIKQEERQNLADAALEIQKLLH